VGVRPAVSLPIPRVSHILWSARSAHEAGPGFGVERPVQGIGWAEITTSSTKRVAAAGPESWALMPSSSSS
jgi:hypothetical protein